MKGDRCQSLDGVDVAAVVVFVSLTYSFFCGVELDSTGLDWTLFT